MGVKFKMAKFHGKIGFGISTETKPGVWKDEISEKNYYGDIVNQRFQNQPSGNVNDDLTIANEISIVADKFAYEHFNAMKYVTYMGTKWKIRSIEVKYPRLILSTGGVYNGA